MTHELIDGVSVTEEPVDQAPVCEALYESVLDSVRDCVGGPVIDAAGPAPSHHSLAANEIVPLLIGATVEEIERELVLQTLGRCDGNRTRAARMLGVSVRTLRNKIRLYAAQEGRGPLARDQGHPRASRVARPSRPPG